jgi:hypothetical protein
MNEPRGFNPVGDHAPGLPQHDRRLPGHVPSEYTPLGESQPIDSGIPMRQAYTGPALPMFNSPWFARCAFFGWVYLTAPIEAALYPIAGVAALAGAGAGYVLGRLLGGGYDLVHGWMWAGCFAGVIAFMRVDTDLAERSRSYAFARLILRLALGFAGMWYVSVHDQGSGALEGIVIAALATGMLYLVLRSKYLRFVWRTLQFFSWMRKTPAGPLNPLE